MWAGYVGFVGDEYVGQGDLIIEGFVAGVTCIEQVARVDQADGCTQVEYGTKIFASQGVDDPTGMPQSGCFDQQAFGVRVAQQLVDGGLQRHAGGTAQATAGDFLDGDALAFVDGAIDAGLPKFVDQDCPFSVVGFLSEQVKDGAGFTAAEKAGDEIGGDIRQGLSGHVHRVIASYFTLLAGNTVCHPRVT